MSVKEKVDKYLREIELKKALEDIVRTLADLNQRISRLEENATRPISHKKRDKKNERST